MSPGCPAISHSLLYSVLGVRSSTFQPRLHEQEEVNAVSALGVIVGNRDFFPDQLVSEGRLELLGVLGAQGIETIVLDETTTNPGCRRDLAGSPAMCRPLPSAPRPDRWHPRQPRRSDRADLRHRPDEARRHGSRLGPEPGEFTLDPGVATCVEAGAGRRRARPRQARRQDDPRCASPGGRGAASQRGRRCLAARRAHVGGRGGEGRCRIDSRHDRDDRAGQPSRERSRGWPDPGATSFAIIAEALVRAFRKQTAAGGSTG